MSTFSKAILVVIFYAIYLLHNSNCLHRNMEDNRSSIGEFVRHIRNMEHPETEKMQICGARLPEMIRLVCKSNYYPAQEKRSLNHEFERYRRASTLISKECCDRGCDKKTLLKYCNLDDTAQSSLTTTPAPLPTPTSKTIVPFKILRALWEFFARTRQLSPNGFESNVRTQPASNVELSSPENTEERILDPEAAALTDEKSTQHRGRHPVSKVNIIRDEEDEGSVFSVGL